MEKKYELTAEAKTVWGVPLHRIRALRSFGDVHQGDLGGWEHITVLHHDVWYTMYPDRTGYNRCKQLYAAQIGGDGCITWYDPGVGDFVRLVYAAADAKPNDYIVVDCANESCPPFAGAKIPPMTQTAFAECDPDAYKVLAGLEATLAEADERERASELDTGDALAKFTWRDDEGGEDET